MNLFAHDRPPDIYRGFQRVLVAQNRIENALEVAEQGRFHALTNLFVTRLSTEPKLPPATGCPNIHHIKEIARHNQATIVEYSILYDDNQLYEASRFKLSFDSRRTYAESLFIWVITSSGKIHFRQVNLKYLWQEKNLFLSSLVRSLREIISGKNQKPTTPSGQEILQQLYQIIIEPIAEFLPKDPQQRIIFIPQDFLFLVPFSALQDSSGTYLIEKHTILTAPSIQALNLTFENKQLKSQESAGLHPCLVVGNPAMPSIFQQDEVPVRLSELPTAELEAQQIAQLLETRPFIGVEATKYNITQNLDNSKILHLATHVLLDDLDGLVGAIALAPGPHDDGFLRLPEIMKRHLTAELVILSACDISRGRLWGDGIIVVASGFIGAGVSSLILSLWADSDAPTPFLMGKFYQNWQETADKAQALRSAMLTTKTQHPHPKDWAGFTLIGNG